MKVALVSEWLDAWRGGAETSTLQFMHHLIEAGVELQVFTRSRPSPAPGLHVHTVTGASMSRTRRSMTFTHRVETLLKGERFDVIHAISPCRAADIYQPRGGTVAESIERNLALIASPPGRSLKRLANHLNFKQRYLLSVEREMLNGDAVSIVVAISNYVADQLRRHYRVPPSRIRTIYNGVDPDSSSAEQRLRDRIGIRRQYRVADGDLLVLLVAHNFRLKGLQRWMEAMSVLAGRGLREVRSLVIGKGESTAWHRSASRLGISDRLTFVGPTDRVREFHHAADVLVHPTYYDPCSRVVLEGMVAGLPCITTRWDGASEMIRNGESGFVLPDPVAVEELAATVKALRNADLRRKIGQAASQVGERVFMVRHAQEMLVLYGELKGHSRHVA